MSSVDTDILSEQVASVRRIARELVCNEHLAEELTQEALLVALRRRPFVPSSWNSWFRGVLRNLLWERRRQEERLRRREERAASPESTPSTVDVLSEMSMHRQVVDTMMGLPGHYRDILYRRYFLDQSPTTIARQCDMPVSTVKTRLARGLALMRESLDEDYGQDRRQWVLAIAGWLGRPEARVALGTPALIALVVLVVGLPSVGLLAWNGLDLFGRSGGGLEGVQNEQVFVPDASGEESEPSDSVESDTVEADRRVAVENEETEEPPSLVQRRELHGVVFDPLGQRLPRMLVRHSLPGHGWGIQTEGTPIAFTDSQGAFTLKTESKGGVLEIANANWVTVLESPPREASDPLILVASKARRLEGRVIDDQERPVSDVLIEVRLPETLESRLPFPPDRTSRREFATSSSEDGRFDLEAAPDCEGVTVRVSRRGYETVTLRGELPSPLEIVLARPVSGSTSKGRVVDESGLGSAGVAVAFGRYVTRTDEGGFFDIPTTDEPAEALIAFKPGRVPAVLNVERVGGSPRWPDPLVLRLGGPPRVLRGKVHGPQGSPCAGFQVWLGNPTVFVLPEGPSDDARTVFSNWSLPRERYATLIEVDGGRGGDRWEPVLTDASGEFEIHGLSERPYDLVVFHRGTLQRQVFPAQVAGKDRIDLVWEPEPLRDVCRARLLLADGTPIPRAKVAAGRIVTTLTYRGKAMTNHLYYGRSVWTDRHGAFELRGLPNAPLILDFKSDEILPLEVRVGMGEPIPDTLTASLGRRVRIELHDPTSCDSASIVTREGKELVIHRRRRSIRMDSERVRIEDGRSEVFSVGAEAALLIAYRGEEAVQEIPLELAAATINVVRF